MPIIDRDAWSARGLMVVDSSPGRGWTNDQFDARFRMLLARTTQGRHSNAVLTVELARSLRDWLTYWVGDGGASDPPTGPDVVRLAIEEQREALRKRSAEQISEDFRAGLAWADNALAAIDRATREGVAPGGR